MSLTAHAINRSTLTGFVAVVAVYVAGRPQSWAISMATVTWMPSVATSG